MVRQPPTSAPSARIAGRPSDTTAMSVVVPPMSETTKSRDAGEKPRADHARGRPGQNGLDRIFERHVGPHQRAVALDDHERRIDRFLDEHLGQCLDQMPDLRREARIEHRRQRAARRIELGAQFMRAGDRLFRQVPRMIWRARSSCAGLRTEKFAATANASTRVSCSATAALDRRLIERRSISSPVAEWPPWIRTTAPPSRACRSPSARPWRRRSRSAACTPG